MTTTCHVRTARLHAGREDDVRRGAILLEDALRTASWPGAEGGRLWLLRTFPVGVIRTTRSPSTLALNIESRFRELLPKAVPALDPAADSRDVVYFHDETEPYAALAVHLASGGATAAWFWPLAVPGWTRDLPKAEAFRVLIRGAARTAAGPAAVTAVMCALDGRDALDPLLAALRREDGAFLLAALGVAPPAGGQAIQEPDPAGAACPPRWRETLMRWIASWGAADERSLWLAAVARMAEDPARVVHPQFLDSARRLAASMAEAAGRKTGVTMRRAGETTIREMPAPPAHPAAPEPIPTPRTPAGGRASALEGQALADETAIDRAPEAPPALGIRGGRGETAGASARPARDGPAIPAAGKPDEVANESLADVEPRGEAIGAAALARREGSVEPEGSRPVPDPAWPAVSSPTAFAGLFHLLPAMAKLDMQGQLAVWPHGIEMDFPRLVLRHVARRLGARDDDAVFQAFGGARCAIQPAGNFLAPARWRQGICRGAPWTIRRLAGSPGARVLAD
jgi:hypothetical protein